MYIEKCRYILCFVSWFTLVVLYIFRTNISVAIISMTGVLNTDSSKPNLDGTNKTSSPTFAWNDQEQGTVLSGFFYGYMATHILGIILAEKIGARYTMMISIFGSTLFTFLMVITPYHGLKATIITRFLVGFFSGPLYPCIHELVGHWAPTPERTLLTVSTHSGNIIGLVANFGLGAVIVNSGVDGWKYFFYFSGIMGVICFILWTVFVYDHPWTHPFITQEEKDYIMKYLYPLGIPVEQHSLKKIPVKQIILSRHVYLIGLAHFGNNFIIYTFLTGHAKFLHDVFKFNVQKASLLSMVPFIGNFLAQLGISYGIDLLIRSKKRSQTFYRKLAGVIGFSGSAIFMFPAGFLGTYEIAGVLIILTISMSFVGANQSSFFTSMVDLSPQYAGITMGICNTLGSLAGVANPSMTGFLTKYYGKLVGWRNTFMISASISFFCGYIWIIFGTSEDQNWKEIDHGKEEETKYSNVKIKKQDEDNNNSKS